MAHYSVLIIGAGASGVAAAARLLENGFNDFKILEAQNRIGGRVFTTAFGDTSVELGAEWIHGEKNNVVYELANKNGFADNSLSTVDFTKTNFYDASGQKINKDITSALMYGYYKTFDKDNEIHISDPNNDSAGKYYQDELKKTLAVIRLTHEVSDDLYKKFLTNLEILENSIDASHSWYETSLKGLEEYWQCDGNQGTVWKNAFYNKIFSLLTKNDELPVKERIIYNKKVVKVKWNKGCIQGTPKVEVQCEDGSVYYADNLLTTCSLGVLKERSEMFEPKLPLKKTKCIENLGFGTVDKIFIKFNECWWGDEYNGFAFLWSEDEKEEESRKWITEVYGFQPITPTTPIMRGWIVGDAARQMESLSDDEVLNGLNYLLGKFLGSSFTVPLIDSFLVSKWYSNPFFRGSYSCRLLKSEREDVWASDLAETVCNDEGKPILYFGGEATHDHYYSTVHGAIEAGFREADKLLENVPSDNVYDVAIVGAGISGLAAAKTLIQNGIRKIIVLEAGSQPGGRIRSVPVDDYFVELGAQWIHGINEVYGIAEENDLISEEVTSEGQGLFLRENGDSIKSDLVSEVSLNIENVLKTCEEFVHGYNDAPSSIGQELSQKFDEYLKSCAKDSKEEKKLKKELYNWNVKFLLIDNGCSDLNNLSARSWGKFKFSGGNEYVGLKNGYCSVIDVLVKSLPENTIHYDCKVEAIHWAEEIEVDKFEDNTAIAKIITDNGVDIYSQYVIVTCSLGYLKEHYKTMFRPSLPSSITQAIECLGFGVLNKIFLIYNKPWWYPWDKGFQLVWSKEMSKESKSDWIRYLTGFDVIGKDKPVLLGWVSGEGAKIVEQVTEDEIGQKTTKILRQFTKNKKIPFPVKVMRSAWWSAEFFKGAYSHISTKCDDDDISPYNLSVPATSTIFEADRTFEKPAIFLAGEATHDTHYSTVHGAYESGVDRAQSICEDIKSRKHEKVA